MNDAQRLTRLLRNELMLQTRHCQLLEAQQRALTACDRTRFMSLQSDYTALVGRLKAQAETRSANGETIAMLLDALPAEQRATPFARRDTLAETLERARNLCKRSEMLISNELAYMAFTLDLFVEAGRRADVSYGGNGRLGRRRLLDRRA
jgi:hypothetical protein